MKTITLLSRTMLLFFSLTAIGPAIGSDDILGIFGNANMDDTIDEVDIEYVRSIVQGANKSTMLADTNYDDKVDENDIAQIEQIIRGDEKELTVIDSDKNIVTIKKPINRVIVQYHDSADVLRAIDDADKIIAVPGERIKTDPAYYPDLSKLPSMGTVQEPDYEAMLGLNPDVFMVYYPSWVDCQKLPGVTCIHLDLLHPENISQSVMIYGYLFNKKEVAKEFDEWHDNWMNYIKSRINDLPENEKPSVFHWWWKEGDVFTASGCKGDYVYYRTANAGGKSITEDLSKNAHIDTEWIIDQDPDIIVVATPKEVGGYGIDDSSGMADIIQSILNRPEFANITAVKNKRVYAVDNRYLMCTATGYVISTAYFAKLFHPDLFKDLDPQAVHQEYLTRFQHLDYDLDKQGVFVYPPLK